MQIYFQESRSHDPKREKGKRILVSAKAGIFHGSGGGNARIRITSSMTSCPASFCSYSLRIYHMHSPSTHTEPAKGSGVQIRTHFRARRKDA